MHLIYGYNALIAVFEVIGHSDPSTSVATISVVCAWKLPTVSLSQRKIS